MAAQKEEFVIGTVARRQFVWWCQKHPFTNTTHPPLLFAKSGEPGKERTFRRYDSPMERKHDATLCSADVACVRTRPIHSLRLGSVGFSAFISTDMAGSIGARRTVAQLLSDRF